MTEDVRIEDEFATGGYHFTFDPKAEPGSDAVVSSLSEATDTDSDDLEPIESVMDPIAFDALVRRRRRPIQISFIYHNYHVTVDTGGDIWLQNSQGESRSAFEITFDADESPSRGVIRAIAEVRGVEPVDVDPLYDVVDPDALDAMFDGTSGTRERDMCVSFQFDDLEIEVTADGRVTVRTATP